MTNGSDCCPESASAIGADHILYDGANVAIVMHRNAADRNKHEELGFHDGWGTVTRQLAELTEHRA